MQVSKLSEPTPPKISVPQVVMDLLKAFKAEQDEEREKLGNRWIDHDRLFVKYDGRPMNNNTPYFWFHEFCEENNFRFCDIHSLRHRNNMKTLLLKLKYINTYIPLQSESCQMRLFFIWQLIIYVAPF